MGVCCYTFLKYLSVILNLLYMIMGGAWLGGVLWVYLNETDIATVANDFDEFNYVLYFLMVVGAIVFILGFLGCCGACHESQCMLATFFALVLVLFMGQVAIGVWVRANEDRFVKFFSETITETIKKDYGRDEIKTSAFDAIQSSLKCCGSEGPTDWVDSHFNGANKEGFTEIGVLAEPGEYKVPKSCCVDPANPDCDTKLDVAQAVNPANIYTEGCSTKVLNFVKTYSDEILYVLLAMLLVQVLSMIVSMILCCTVRRIEHVKA